VAGSDWRQLPGILCGRQLVGFSKRATGADLVAGTEPVPHSREGRVLREAYGFPRLSSKRVVSALQPAKAAAISATKLKLGNAREQRDTTRGPMLILTRTH